MRRFSSEQYLLYITLLITMLVSACADSAENGALDGDTDNDETGEQTDGDSDLVPDRNLIEKRCPVIDPTLSAQELAAQPPAFCDEDKGGGGIFGYWGLDERNLPEYRYTMEADDPRAKYFNSEGDNRTDHWHLFGDAGMTAMAHAGGYVELFDGTRGAKFMNAYDPAIGAFAGGFAIIEDDGEIWTTADKDALQRPVHWRMDGVQYHSQKNELSVSRTIRAMSVIGYNPSQHGNISRLVSEITIRNESDQSKVVTFHEYWDANPVQVTSGLAGGDFSQSLRNSRRELTAQFVARPSRYVSRQDVEYLALSIDPIGDPPVSRDEVSATDYYLPDIAAAFLDFSPDETQTDGPAFFEKLGILPKIGTISAGENDDVSDLRGTPMPDSLILSKTFHLPPGAFRTFHSILAVVSPDITGDLAYYYLDPEIRRNSMYAPPDFAENLAMSFYIATEDNNWLPRELTWHLGQLTALLGYDGFYQLSLPQQGSAYRFIQGANGAVRDIILAILPFIYLNLPAAGSHVVGENSIKLVSALTRPNGWIWYSMYGYGMVSGALIHNHPSDLDLFFLWLITEYALANQQTNIFEVPVPYYDQSGKAPDYLAEGNPLILDHVQLALDHFDQTVGLGAHGMSRLWDGDWSDGIILRSEDPDRTREEGESAFNSAMACYVLPRLADKMADVISRYEQNPLADRYGSGITHANTLANTHCTATSEAWIDDHIIRGWLNSETRIGAEESLYLEPQPFAMLSDALTQEQKRTLLDTVHENLDAPTPYGQLHLSPPSDVGSNLQEPGSDTNGGIWNALGGLYSWAASTIDPEVGYQAFLKNSMHAHAEAYPDIWYGIWSGPDALNAPLHERPGETFLHLATPMVDYPIGNSNQHAAPLIAAIKGAGVTRIADGYQIDPLWKERPLVIHFGDLRIAYTNDEAAIYPAVCLDAKISMLPPGEGESWEVTGLRYNPTKTEILTTEADGFLHFDMVMDAWINGDDMTECRTNPVRIVRATIED